MAQETYSKADFWAELDSLGEDIVRERLIAKRYGDVGPKHDLAIEWLRIKDQGRLEEREGRRQTRETIAAIAAIVAAVAATIGAISSIMILFSK
jgi:hypothetical protein